MNSKLKKISKTKNSTKENSLLSTIISSMLIELNLVNKVPFLINRYIKHAKNTGNSILARRTRSSLTNSLVDDEITWKTFIDLLFNLIRIRELKIIIKLEHNLDIKLSKHRYSQHSLTITKDDYEDGSENEILTKLNGEILKYLKITDEEDIREMIENAINRAKLVKDTKMRTKSSIFNSVMNKAITWKIFLDILFKVYDIQSVIFTVELTHAVKTKSIHTVKFKKD